MQKSVEISAEIIWQSSAVIPADAIHGEFCGVSGLIFAYSIVRRLASKSCFQDSSEFYKNIFRNACGVPLDSCVLGPPTKIAFEFMHAELYRSCCGVSAC